MKKTHLAMALAAVTVGAGVFAAVNAQPRKATVKMSLAQARQTVDMLNDLYVNATVVIHDIYVKERNAPPAAIAARKIFQAMADQGWPQTRWLSTGRAFNPDHDPKDQFERDAVAALRTGKPRFERVENGQLRVATLIPLVDKSCQTCHSTVKVGDPVGGLSYTIPLNGS